MNNRSLLQAMALDLKRIALAYHTHSLKTAERFLKEVMQKKTYLTVNELPEEALLLLSFLDNIPEEKSLIKRADDALMLSTLFISFSTRLP